MRELRKETETKNTFLQHQEYLFLLIRNERTPKGDGNVFSSSFISEKLNINKK